MDATTQPEQPDVRVLQGLYQRYLQEAVNLAEENVRLQVRVAELEAAQATD